MQTAEMILDIVRERGKRGLPLERVYRLLYNPQLYQRAYTRLAANQGVMTPGTTPETIDGMSQARIEQLIDDLQHERFHWPPARRIYIPKKDGKRRPLGLPTWTAKLLQEVIRTILEAYYEPQFSDHSHGFRPGRGCHTALSMIQTDWTGTKWWIEGDIQGCFDNIDHTVLLRILNERIHDNRFVGLIQRLLQAGYMEEWRYNVTLSGTPQGSVLSPLLTNLVLNELDRFVEQQLLGAYNRGKRRQTNAHYVNLAQQTRRLRKRGRLEEAKAMRHQARQMPSQDPDDPNYRRLHYVRYADDFLLGFVGPKAEAEVIKGQLRDFLRDHLKLELSEAKTLITHARDGAARFLGYEMRSMHADDKLDYRGRRSINGHVMLRVPADVITALCSRYERSGKPDARPILMEDDDFTIVSRYQQELRGYVNYYLLAHNVSTLYRLKWVMETSMLKTLANKHKTTVTTMARKYRTKVMTATGVLTCFRVEVQRGEAQKPLVAQFGGFAIRRRKDAVLVDQMPFAYYTKGTELLKRLLADKCELCGSRANCQVHHIRKLANLKRSGRREKPAWVHLMVARRRKTLVVCQECHVAIHAGRPTRRFTSEQITGEPSAGKTGMLGSAGG